MDAVNLAGERGRKRDYVKRNHDRIVEVRKGGKDYNNGWGDLVIMFYALSDPAAAYLDATPDCNLEGGNTHAFMYHWIQTLNMNTLGINDATVTADHPLVGVFTKNGKKSYAAYNFGSRPLTVAFSDGTKLSTRPRTITVLTP